MDQYKNSHLMIFLVKMTVGTCCHEMQMWATLLSLNYNLFM